MIFLPTFPHLSLAAPGCLGSFPRHLTICDHNHLPSSLPCFCFECRGSTCPVSIQLTFLTVPCAVRCLALGCRHTRQGPCSHRSPQPGGEGKRGKKQIACAMVGGPGDTVDTQVGSPGCRGSHPSTSVCWLCALGKSFICVCSPWLKEG